MIIKSRVIVLAVSLSIYTSPSIAQWALQTSGTNEILTDVIMLDSATAIAVGQGRSILRTSDAGATWINITAPLSSVVSWNSVSFFDTSNGIVAGEHGCVMTTINGGRNWSWHNTPAMSRCLSTLHVGPSDMYVGTDSGWIYHSLDSGATWSAEKISTEPVRSLFAWRGAFTMGLPISALTPHSLYSTVVFPPAPWEEKPLPFHGLGSEAFSGESSAGGGPSFIVGVQGDFISSPVILRKSVSDTVWKPVSTGLQPVFTPLGVSVPSADIIYVCGTNGTILKSTDGGDSWNAATVPTTHNLYAISFLDEKEGFAVGDNGVILHTSNGGTTGMDDGNDRFPKEFVLDQNYPNPFNATTVIRYALPSDAFVKLNVYDILGRNVKTLVGGIQIAGAHTATFTAENLASGVYCYRLQAGPFNESKKFLLLK